VGEQLVEREREFLPILEMHGYGDLATYGGVPG
jgi:hypothetical protein